MTDEPSMLRPICFVLMPFGTKQDENHRTINFDTVFTAIIEPAVTAAGMDCIRADAETVGGIIHKPMFERLWFCEFAVADLTTANANVFYELGVRHALRPFTTVLISAQGSPLPFDLGPVRRAHAYHLDDAGSPTMTHNDVAALTEQLRAVSSSVKRSIDSPVYQLLAGLGDWQAPDPDEVDAFHDRMAQVEELRQQLHAASDTAEYAGTEAAKVELISFESRLGKLEATTLGLAAELLLAYRGVEAYEEMIALVARLPEQMSRLPMIREQYALALNRSGDPSKAIRVLGTLIRERGPSSETCGILGRVHKDRWEAELTAGRTAAAEGHLERAIDTYVQGFEVDWRDYYPGINAVELMTLRDPDDPRIATLLPVVRYSAERAVEASPDYWGQATMLELAILANDVDDAQRRLGRALAASHDQMMIASTTASLRRVLAAKRQVGDDMSWLEAIVDQLSAAGRG